MEFTNTQLDIWTRSTSPTLVEQVYDCGWFELDSCTDPRVLYDPDSGRYFAAIQSNRSFVVAVSSTSDPTGPWYRQTVTADVDNPRLVVTTDKVIIGDNGPDIWVFEKSDFHSATAEPVSARVVHLSSELDPNAAATYGPVTLEVGSPSSADGYAISRGGTDTTAALINRITGTPATHDVALTATVLHLPYPWADPLLAPQQGGPLKLSPQGFYPTVGTLAAGSIWFAMTESCMPAGDSAQRDCVHLVQIDISKTRPTLVYELSISVAGRYLLDPAVTVDSLGRAVVAATETGADMHPSVVGIPVRADGVSGQPTVLRAGTSYTEVDNFASGQLRWGDYSAATVDPTDPDQLWLGGEFALDEQDWGTSISAVHIDDPDCPELTSCAPGTFRTIAPTRIVDTRSRLGGITGPMHPHGTVTVPISENAGIPAAGVAAVAVNLTAASSTRAGYLVAYPSERTPPQTSTLNFPARTSVAGQAIVPVAADGSIRIYNGSSGTTQLLVDVSGYYLAGRVTAPGGFVPMNPTRVLDTRAGIGAAQHSLTARATTYLQLATAAAIPGGSTPVLTITATNGQKGGYLQAYPNGQPIPPTSTLNFPAATAVANLAIIRLGANGDIALRNASTGTIDVTADLAGYYLPGSLTATGATTAPPGQRVLDTRTGRGAPHPITAGGTITVSLAEFIPANATAILINIAVVQPAGPGYLVAHTGTPTPPISTLNLTAGRTTTNLAVLESTVSRSIQLTNRSSRPINVIADLTGYSS